MRCRNGSSCYVIDGDDDGENSYGGDDRGEGAGEEGEEAVEDE